ncbi:hypothetical protein [Clostridium sp.]
MENIAGILLILLIIFIIYCIIEWLTLPSKVKGIEEQLKRIADKLEG